MGACASASASAGAGLGTSTSASLGGSLGTSAGSSTSAGAGTPERACPVAKVSETADRSAAVLELCPCTAAELACATLVRKGARIVMRHGARERCWRVPFALAPTAAVSARCRETVLPAGGGSYSMLEVTVVRGATRTAEPVVEGVVVPASTNLSASGSASATPAVRTKTSTPRGFEAYLPACRTDVTVALSILHTENAQERLEFSFAFREPLPDGSARPRSGRQNIPLSFVCHRDDVHVALHDAVLTVSIRPPPPTPANPSDPEYPIPIVQS